MVGTAGWVNSLFFFFGFRRCMSFSWFFGMGVIGAPQKGGKLSLSGISSLFLEESREVTGRSVLCSNPIA